MTISTPRMTKTAILSAILVAVVAAISPQQVPVIIYKTSLALLAGVAGYALDRAIYPYARIQPPKAASISPDLVLYITSQLRRAIIVAAVIVAVGLGL